MSKEDLILEKLTQIEQRLANLETGDKADTQPTKSFNSKLSHSELTELTEYAIQFGFTQYKKVIYVNPRDLYNYLNYEIPHLSEFILLGGTKERYFSLKKSGANMSEVIQDMKQNKT